MIHHADRRRDDALGVPAREDGDRVLLVSIVVPGNMHCVAGHLRAQILRPFDVRGRRFGG